MSVISGSIGLGNRPELNLGLPTDDDIQFNIKGTKPPQTAVQITNPLKEKIWGGIFISQMKRNL